MQRPRKNAKYYRFWGLIYYNPEDPSFFADKQFGYGQSINFAHGGAWWLMVFVLVFPLLVLLIPVILS